MIEINLGEGWRLLETPLDWGNEQLSRVMATKDGWMDCALPCDVHMPLEKAGRIKNVVLADYCFEAEWIEKRAWWFVREFSGAEIDLGADVIELSLTALDAHADVFLNGEWLGAQINAFYPFTRGVKGRVRPEKNKLAVRVTTGLEQVSDADLAELNWAVTHESGNGNPLRGDRRRGFLRKPAYTTGWDWGPKAPSCGIVGGAFLRCYRKTAIRGAHVTTEAAREGEALLKISVEIDQLHVFATRDADVEVSLSLDGDIVAAAVEKDVLLTSGLNFVDLQIVVPGARLWWPNGSGAQPLYRVEVAVTCEGAREAHPPFLYGIRTIELDTARTGGGTRRFSLLVNDVPVFCKGADWIPADAVYARVTREKYEALVSEAREANFNMLRVWGGGIYEPDVFYEACDRAGILLWHDFMFGCSTYPDHLDWFRREVEREMDYQTRRLRNHPSLALFCGNNENHWIFNPADNPSWHIDISYEKQYGLLTGNELAKVAVRGNCPEIPYWNSSPYGGARPNADEVGDVHCWNDFMMNRDMEKRIDPAGYDGVNARFVTEYGYPGPCPRASIEDYFDGRAIDRDGAVWDHHNNTFEKHTVAAGIEKHYPVKAEALSLDEYILYAGMTQSLMLGYSLEAIRFKDFCGGALFWMYSDTWGEVGWTIVDYYLRRKIAYYGVKRAFAPVKLVLRRIGGKAVLRGFNDTAEEIRLDARMGYMPFDGTSGEMADVKLTLPARSRTVLLEAALPTTDDKAGVFCILPANDVCEPAMLRTRETRELKLPGGNLEIVREEKTGADLLVTLKSDAYLHGVHVKEDLRLSDNYFDLLPGYEKTVRIQGAVKSPVWHTVC